MKRVFILGSAALFFGFSFILPGKVYSLSPAVVPKEIGSIQAGSEPMLKIMFAGDLFFDREIRRIMQERGDDYIFSCISDYLNDADLVVGNLEGPITDNQSKSLGTKVGSAENFVFTFPVSVPELLAKNNIKIVNLGNNHIMNFGYSGLLSTQEYLSKGGVGFFGGYRGNEPVYRIEQNGLKISFVSFNEFGGQSIKDVSKLIQSEVAEEYKVIVFAHWGDEYSDNVSRLRDAASIFIKSGASAIFGSHPHIVTANEIIENAPVYYSLGNFIFDQYWNDKVTTGEIVTAEIRPDSIKTSTAQTKIFRDGRVCLSSQIQP